MFKLFIEDLVECGHGFAVGGEDLFEPWWWGGDRSGCKDKASEE